MKLGIEFFLKFPATGTDFSHYPQIY